MSAETLPQLLHQLFYKKPPPAMWFLPETLADLALIRYDKAQWGEVKTHAKLQGINPWDLEGAVDEAIAKSNGYGPEMVPLTFPDVREPLMPLLPHDARFDVSLAEGAAPWLEAYCAHSRHWAPRAAQGFHQAVGLWLLSMVAARRVCVHLGTQKFPMLFLALIAPSTLYTKSTTAHVAQKALESIGCRFFLTPDRQSPQALIRRMSGRVPEDYGSQDAATQIETCRQMAFAGQRGWYYDEWGGMLQQMRRSDSVIAEFHGLLKVLDDNLHEYENDTIARGLDRITEPSLALLASATVHDLAPYMKEGAAWWRDGFWPRFALITPYEDEEPSLIPQPQGLDTLPSSLVIALRDWHERLGIPSAEIVPMLDAKGKPVGTWKVQRAPFFPQVLPLSASVLQAYHTYNEALLTMVIRGEVHADLSGCYGRFHEKALRIAILLASLGDCKEIEMPHWVYAQQVVEGWRGMLHRLIRVAADVEPLSPEAVWERRIERLLETRGALTARVLQQNLSRCSSRDLHRMLDAMSGIGRIVTVKKGRAMLYMMPIDAPPEEGENDEASDVPF